MTTKNKKPSTVDLFSSTTAPATTPIDSLIAHAIASAVVVSTVNTAPTFALENGKVITAMDSCSFSEGHSVTVQSDGKILLAGYSRNGNYYTDFALARYNSNGSLDTSFDGDGKVITAVGTSYNEGYSVTVQSDNKILVAGYSLNNSYYFALVRYNTDGSLNSSFDGDGKVTTAVSPYHNYGYSVALQSDGKILVAGTSNSDFALVRYNSDGSLDTSFDGDGKVTTAVGTLYNQGYSVTVQSDGKILVAGSSLNSGNYDFALVRYNNDGSLDSSFDGDGKVTTAMDTFSQDGGYSVTLQSDGKILVAGSSNSHLALVRYNSNGSLDSSFDGDGKVTTAVGSGRSVTVQNDGKILVAAYSDYNAFVLVRYNNDGSLDSSFDSDGIVITTIGISTASGCSVTVQNDGKILLAGSSDSNFALVRYNSDGSLDSSFEGANTLNNAASYIENDITVLDSSVQVYDAELVSQGNYAGASLTLARHDGANSQDVFSAWNNLSFNNGNAILSGKTIGTVSNSNGILTLNFNNNATQTLVNQALSSLAYSNTSDTPPSSVQIDWTFNDGNNGAQGTGGALASTGSTTVNITDVNDRPTLTSFAAPVASGNKNNQITISFADLQAQGDEADIDGTVTSFVVGAVSSGSLKIGTSAANVKAWSKDNSIIDATHQAYWTPAANANGTLNAFKVTAKDNGGSQSITPVQTTVSVTANNNAPTFVLGDGKVTTGIGYIDKGYSVTLQSDSKILVAGSSFGNKGWNFALVRYNSDGSLDSSFDGDGIVTTDMATTYYSDEKGYSVTVQSDGKILVAGSSFNDSWKFALVRYNSDGSLDTSFDGDGIVTTAVGGYGDNAAYSVTVQSDGKILVTGLSNYSGFTLVRYNSDGSLDSSFDGDGIVFTDVDTSYAMSYSVTVQSDGKILVAGFNYSGSTFALVRYNSDGSLDSSFDGDGIVTTAVGNYGDRGAYSVTLQSDGKILVSGSSYNSDYTSYEFALVRYNNDGSLDSSFDGDGKVTTAIDASYDSGYSVTLQSDGKILVVGSSYNNGSYTDFTLVRYNSDGSLDSSFDGDGIVTTAVSNYSDYGYSVTVQSDGKILVAGSSHYNGSGSYTNFALVRYNSDGSLDTTFNDYTPNATSNYTENGAAVVLDDTVHIIDADLAAQGNYAGASISLARHGGANSQDLFSVAGNVSFAANQVLLSGLAIGTFTLINGALTITFNSDATQAYVNETLSSLTYANSSTTPPASVQIDWTFSDGNTGAQGTGGALTALGSTMVNITPVNNMPITDFNADGKSDLLWTHSDGSIYAMTMNGLTMAGGSLVYDSTATANGTWQVVNSKGDYDGDGKTDLLLWNSTSNSAYLAQMNGTAIGSQGAIDYAQNITGWTIADSSADYNNDGKSDILWWNSSTSTVYLALQNGAALLSGGALFSNISGWAIQSAGGDYNGDGNSDILLWNASTHSAYVATMNGLTISGQDYVVQNLPSAWSIVDAKGDYNGDGRSDILFRNSATGELWAYQMNGTAISNDAHVATVDNAWQIVSAHNDFNGDGKSDILWQHTDGSAWISLVDGNSITSSVNLGAYANWTVQNADNDVNGDGKADVLWTNTDGTAYIMEMDGVSIIGGGALGPYSGWAVSHANLMASGNFAVELTGGVEPVLL